MTDVLLGIVFFGALIGLGMATIVLSDFKFGVKRYDVEILSPDVGYLQAGDPVLLFGMPSGKVVDILRLPEPVDVALGSGRTETCTVAIRTRLEVDIYEQLPVDSRLIIEDRGLLGGKLIRVESGSSTQLVERDAALVAITSVSALQSAGEIIAENRNSVRRAVEALVQMLEQGNRSGGLLGALLWDEMLAADFKHGVENISEVTDGLRNGEGTLGKLLRDDEMYDEGQVAIADVQGFFASAKDVSDQIKSGEGTIGKLIYSDDVHGRIIALSDDISGSDSVLGLLLHDEELASKFKSIINQVLGAVEDARESSPVQGVGSFLFGTF
jgi:phospholipid/cholesterol/gamma-HCH transport system substrate-binding protein